MELLGISLGLGKTLRYIEIGPLSLNHCQFLVLVFQHIVGDVLLGSGADPLQTPKRNDFTFHPTGINHAPSSTFNGWINKFGSGFGFVHSEIL